jgi:hypothetical protein
MLDAIRSGISLSTLVLTPKEKPMVGEREIPQTEQLAGKSSDRTASSTVANAIEGDSLSPHRADGDARHSRISEAAYRIAAARGFAGGLELDDWLAAEREVDAIDQERLMPGSKPAPAQPSPEASASTTPGRPRETASRQQTRPDQNSQTGSAELDEAAPGYRDASAAVPERPADAK